MCKGSLTIIGVHEIHVILSSAPAAVFFLLILISDGFIQVRNVDGNFVAATPIKGTVLVNIADLMQRWTADRLKSTVFD